MKDNGFKAVHNFYYYLMQKGDIYLMNNGNSITEEGQLFIKSYIIYW